MLENYDFNFLRLTRRVFNHRKLFFAASLSIGLLAIYPFLTRAASGNAGVFSAGYYNNKLMRAFDYAGYFSAPADAVNVSVPANLSVLKGAALAVPVIVSDTTGRGITSFDFRLNYDPAAFSASPPFADKAETLAHGFEVNVSNPAPGTLIVSGFGTAPLTGSGVLLRFSLLAVSSTPVCRDLGLSNFAFNEGNPPSAVSGGNACVTIATVANGDILFTSSRDGNDEIYKMNSGGGEQQRLTETTENESGGLWSPDGRKILYSKSIDAATAQIWVMNADGSNKNLLSDAAGLNVSAEWSPNGQKILFSKRLPGGTENLWTMNPDGTNKIRLTASTMTDQFAEWSPDANRIAFGRCGANSVCDVYTMNADGANQINLTANNPDDDDHPVWSNDGGKIIFGRGSSEFYNAFVMNAGGMNVQQLTDSTANGAYNYRVAGKVSPDGSKAALIRTARIADANYLNSFEIAAVNLTDGSLTNLTDNSVYDIFGDWSPDGSQIVFTTRRDTATDEIYVMNAGGGSVVRLTSNSAADTVTDWQSFTSAYTAPTSAGQNVQVAAENFALNFGSISTPGETIVTVLEPEQVPTVPSGFTISGTTLVYEIETTAEFSGNIVVSFDVPDVADEAACSLLRVLHYTNGAWDTSNNANPVYNSANRICTVSQTVTSLSPFLITGLNSYSISGRITDGVNPLSGVTVNLTGYSNVSAITNPSGNFSFRSLPENQNYTVTPVLTNYAFAPVNYVFNNLSANQTANFAATNTCTYGINPTSINVTATTAAGSVAVTAPSGCAWMAATTETWLSVTSGATGSGNGTVGYSVFANNGAARTGTITIAGQTFTVSQAAAAASFEGDVASRPNGDGVIFSDDVIQVQRFQIGLNLPYQANEFQRADSAPFATFGDGFIRSDDVVQAQRYQISLNPKQNAAGPLTAFTAQSLTDFDTAEQSPAIDKRFWSVTKTGESAGGSRDLSVQSVSSSAGQQVVVNILADALGDESGYGFQLNFNQAILTNPTTVIGTAGGSRLCNTTTTPGQITCSVNNFSTDRGGSTDQIGEIAEGNDQILVRVTFTIAAGASPGAVAVVISQVNASNDAAQSLTPIAASSGTATIVGPTAAQVAVSGRVLTAHGRGIRNVRVTMTDSGGNARTGLTTAFGYFRFENIAAGETYILSVSSKRYLFVQPTRVLSLNGDLAEVDFVAQE